MEIILDLTIVTACNTKTCTAADLAIEVNNAMMIAKTQLELGHCFRGLARSGEAAAAYTRAAEALETMGAEPRAKAIREGFLNE